MTTMMIQRMQRGRQPKHGGISVAAVALAAARQWRWRKHGNGGRGGSMAEALW